MRVSSRSCARPASRRSIRSRWISSSRCRLRRRARRSQRTLEVEGFTVDSREEPEGGYSLHGNREMRLIVPDMQALTARFTALAVQHGGKYDGWAVAKKIPKDRD